MRRYIALLMSAVLVGIDQILKILAIEHLKPAGSCPIIPDIFHFTYVENRGAAFGMMAGQKWLLIWVTAIVILAAVVVIVTGKIKNTTVLFAVTTIIGGGVGNLIDRVRVGYVVDMFHFEFWPSYPVFNVADMCIVCGAILGAIYYLWIYEKYDAKPKKGASDGDSDTPTE